MPYLVEEVTKRLEELFETLCDAEGFDLEDRSDRGYIDDKADIWYEMGMISQDDHALIKLNWGEGLEDDSDAS